MMMMMMMMMMILQDLYSSPNTIRVIKARTIWAEHVPRMGTKKNAPIIRHAVVNDILSPFY